MVSERLANPIKLILYGFVYMRLKNIVTGPGPSFSLSEEESGDEVFRSGVWGFARGSKRDRRLARGLRDDIVSG